MAEVFQTHKEEGTCQPDQSTTLTKAKDPLYSVDGRVVDGTIVDSDGRDVTGSGTESTAGMSVADVLSAIRQAKANLVPENPGRTSRVAEAFAKYRQIRQVAEQFPNPATAEIDVHRSGILRQPDPRTSPTLPRTRRTGTWLSWKPG